MLYYNTNIDFFNLSKDINYKLILKRNIKNLNKDKVITILENKKFILVSILSILRNNMGEIISVMDNSLIYTYLISEEYQKYIKDIMFQKIYKNINHITHLLLAKFKECNINFIYGIYCGIASKIYDNYGIFNDIIIGIMNELFIVDDVIVKLIRKYLK